MTTRLLKSSALWGAICSLITTHFLAMDSAHSAPQGAGVATTAQKVHVHLSGSWTPEQAGALEQPKRGLASVLLPEWVLITHPRKKSKSSSGEEAKPSVRRINPTAWRELSDGERYELLKNSFFATARERSKSGLKHDVCFVGPGSAFVAAFFGEIASTPIRYVTGDIDLSVSRDEYLVGIEAKMAEPNTAERDFHFRIPACDTPGKNLLVSVPEVAEPKAPGREPQSVTGGAAWTPERIANILNPLRVVASGSTKKDERSKDRTPQSVVEEGFDALDPGPNPYPRNLPRFKIAGEYENDAARWVASKDRPWKGMDLTKAEEREKFAVLLLDYFYEGMIDQNREVDFNLIAQSNAKRAWCHMPWLNVGQSGREAVHGLTRERPLEPSPIYPDAPWGSNWGIGYFNGAGCNSMAAVWGDINNPLDPPVFERSKWNGLKEEALFEDATVAAKVLFTTADFPALKGTVAMKAHVTPEEGVNTRKLSTIRLVQIDIAVKDSSLKGTLPELDHWLMLTYYFDPTYRMASTRTNRAVAHPGWYSMRPVGVQLSLESPEEGGSFIFAGSKTNGNGGRLNGPADNPKSSCLGCHGTAGTRVFMAPGFMSRASYLPYREQALEFSQQLALARRNYETRAKKARGPR